MTFPDHVLTRNRLKELASLTRRRQRQQLGSYLAEGLRTVESAIKAEAPIIEILVTEEVAANNRVQRFLAETDARISFADTSDLAKLADTKTSQNIIAVIELPDRSLDLVGPGKAVVVLDAVQDPGNVGTIVRTAAWFGVTTLVVGPGTADPYGQKSVRSAMGGLWDVRIAEVADLKATLVWLQTSGFDIVGADLQGSPISEWRPSERTALVLGSEAHGLSSDSARFLNGRIRIDSAQGRRGVESLNVAAAAGIIMHRWLGQ
ncbi:RNA methyltransferase [soil metagenome]